MTALAKDRFTKAVGDGHGPLYVDLPQGVNTIYEGSMVARLTSGGFACPGATASSGPACGVARVQSVNTGSAGDVSVQLSCGQFWFLNGDSIVEADRFKVCYMSDDQTVKLANVGGALQVAGIIIDVDSVLGVKVLISPEVNAQLADVGGPLVQYGSGTFSAGVLTVSTGITVTASSAVIANRKTEAGTDGDEIRVPSADRTVGAPGTGALTFRAFLSGVAATSDTSTFDYIIVG